MFIISNKGILMGTHAAIVRRLPDNTIQYGNIINDGFLSYVGIILMVYYDSPKLVEQLFSLGQLETLGAPGTENNPALFDTESKTYCTNRWKGHRSHRTCDSEMEICPEVMFTDYYYFYDNEEWFYVKPDCGWQKIPLHYVLNRLSYFSKYPNECPQIMGRNEPDTCVRYEMDIAYLKEILFEYPKEDAEYKQLLDASEINIEETFEELRKTNFPLYEFLEKHLNLVNYFDPWSVYMVGESHLPPSKVKLRKKSEQHVETYFWNLS